MQELQRVRDDAQAHCEAEAKADKSSARSFGLTLATVSTPLSGVQQELTKAEKILTEKHTTASPSGRMLLRSS